MMRRANAGWIRGLLHRWDHWLILRAPMMWRTRPLGALVALGLLVLATLPIVETRIEVPVDTFAYRLDASGVRQFWSLQVGGAVAGLVTWVWLILRRPVGEVALQRHLITVVAVGLVSYLWLVTPSLLALVEVQALRRVDISARTLESDREVLARHNNWACIPPRVWQDEKELAQIRNAIGRYRKAVDVRLEKAPGCDEKESQKLTPDYESYFILKDIAVLLDAKSLGSDSAGPNQFSRLCASLLWFTLPGLGMGILAAALSYPSYVWRRNFLR